MTFNDRIPQIEAVIAEQEARGEPWTNAVLYDAVGGSYAQLAAYMKERRARTAAWVAEEEAPLSLDALRQVQREELTLLGELRARREDGPKLDRDEYIELLVLEDATRQREGQLVQAERAWRRALAHSDMAAAQQVHDTCVPTMVDAAQAMLGAIAWLFEKRRVFEAVYQQQHAPLTALTDASGRQVFEFPDASAVLQWMLSLLPHGSAWIGALLTNTSHAPTVGEAERCLAAVPGTKPLSRVAVQNYLRGFDNV